MSKPDFNIWGYGVDWICDVKTEEDAAKLAVLFPSTIYFFAELS